MLKTFFFFACRFFPPGVDAGFTKRGGGGGAPIQALAPGRWRPSLRHWGEHSVVSLLAVGRWFPPGTPVSSTIRLISSSFLRLDMTLAAAVALNPNKPNQRGDSLRVDRCRR